jgi:hypothetical protein
MFPKFRPVLAGGLHKDLATSKNASLDRSESAFYGLKVAICLTMAIVAESSRKAIGLPIAN